MTFAEIERVEALRRRIAKWNEMIERWISKRDAAQGRLDELLKKHTIDSERIQNTIELYRKRMEKLQDMLEE